MTKSIISRSISASQLQRSFPTNAKPLSSWSCIPSRSTPPTSNQPGWLFSSVGRRNRISLLWISELGFVNAKRQLRMPFSREEKAKAKAAQWGKASTAQSPTDDSTDRCCKPGGCLKSNGALDDPSDRVRVLCSSDACTLSGLMHIVCFNDFEEQVLTFLKGTGRARSWSDKQRRQNLWNKKGYDLAFKACNCDCGKGYLKKDVDFKPPAQVAGPAPDLEDKKKKKAKKTSEKPAINLGKPGPIGSASHARSYSSSSGYSTCSSSSGSLNEVSAGSSASSAPVGNGTSANAAARKSSNGSDSGLSTFPRRPDMNVLKSVLPRSKINPYSIRMDDDVLGGSDDLRQLVLGGLAGHRATKLPCCLCRRQLCVYDKYPVVDGVIFLTPLEPRSTSPRLPVRMSDVKMMYALATCVQCMVGRTRVVCRGCNHPWSGENLMLGAIYGYDIFAAFPCCEERVLCAECQRPAIEQTGASMLSYSQCSGVFGCEHCSFENCHLVRPLSSYEVAAGTQWCWPSCRDPEQTETRCCWFCCWRCAAHEIRLPANERVTRLRGCSFCRQVTSCRRLHQSMCAYMY